MKKEPMLPYLWMLSGSFAFAVMGSLIHALGSDCDWQVIAIARAFLALVFAAGLAVMAGARLVILATPTLWLRSLAGSLSLICTFFAFTHLPVSDVLTLTNMFPIWVAILSWPVLRERPSGSAWVCVVSGIVGVCLIQQPHIAEGNFACLVALSSSFTTAIAMLGLHKIRDVDARAIVAHFSGVSLLFSVAALYLFDRTKEPESILDQRILLMLLAVGAAATIGQLFLTKAFAAGAPARVSVVGLSQVLFAMGFDVLIWQRSFDFVTLLGMGLIMAPTAWLLGRSR